MLQLLKESASSRHAERLEQIVIALIGVEIGWSSILRQSRLLKIYIVIPVIGITTIVVDLLA